MAFPWQGAQGALLPSDPKAVLSGSALPSAFGGIRSSLPLHNEVTAQGLRRALLSSRVVFLSSFWRKIQDAACYSAAEYALLTGKLTLFSVYPEFVIYVLKGSLCVKNKP